MSQLEKGVQGTNFKLEKELQTRNELTVRNERRIIVSGDELDVDFCLLPYQRLL